MNHMKTVILLVLCLSTLFSFSQDWIQKQDFPGPARDDGASFKIGNKAYCGTGMNSWRR
jgi:N-acetylneuraminic acid mutarotase